MSRLMIDLEELKKQLDLTEYKVKDDSIEIIKEAGKIAVRRNSQIIKEGDIIVALAKIEPHLKNIIINSDIEEDDFEDYCEELVIDCGYIPKDFPSWIEIDWEATASNMKQDYSELDYQGITYLFRA